MSSLKVRKLTYAALLLALAVMMPRVAGLIPDIGKTLNLMHIPVLLCGFLCGWSWGLVVGFTAPLLSSLLNGMPGIFPDATVMAFELAVYGGLAGLLYRRLPETRGRVYIVLVLSMIAGRVVWGIARLLLAGLSGSSFTWALFIAGAVTNAIPGILLHLVLIPALVIVMERAGLSLNRRPGHSV